MPPKIPRCPYCLDDLQPDQEMVRCAQCRKPHHEPCFRENAGCVSFGCTGLENVEAGLSIFTKPSIQIRHEPTEHHEFGPFVLGCRRLVSIPETRRQRRCPHAYARLTFENREMREGDLTRGRGVVYVPEAATFKRIDLYLFQGIQRPQEVARVSLVSRKGQLERGSHPIYLELRAPPAIPFMDPFQLEMCLVRSVFKELRSSPLAFYLLQRRFARPTAEQRIRVAPRPPSHAILAAPPGSEYPPVVPPPRAAASQAGPGSANGWYQVPITSIGSLYDSGGPTGRVVPVRFCPAPGASQKRLELDAPSMPMTPEFAVSVGGGGPLSSLNLAIQYELVRPGGGGEVVMPGFPAVEELRLLGVGSLDANAYGEGTGLEFVLTVPRDRMALFAEARQSVAHNAALRIHLALDGIERGGHVMPAVSRSITFTAP